MIDVLAVVGEHVQAVLIDDDVEDDNQTVEIADETK
ncbi:hypothetical protein L914_04184, partial [Phytophthora nicotianae]